MTLVSYRHNNLFPVLRGVEGLFDRFFQRDFFPGDLTEEGFVPTLNIALEKDEIVISAELPGVKADDIQLNFEDGVLTISGEKKAEDKEEGKDYYRMERSYGKFIRKVRLPSDVDEENTSARFEDGVLWVRVKLAEAPKPKSIPIETK